MEMLCKYSLIDPSSEMPPKTAYGPHSCFISITYGDIKPPKVPNTIPSDVAIERIGVGNSSAAHR